MKFSDYKKKILQGDKEFRIKYLSPDFDFETCNLITVARLHKGLTQAELAKRIGTKQPSIARVERGHLPTLPFLKKIASAIGTTLIPPRFAFMNEAYTKIKESNDFSRSELVEYDTTEPRVRPSWSMAYINTGVNTASAFSKSDVSYQEPKEEVLKILNEKTYV